MKKIISSFLVVCFVSTQMGAASVPRKSEEVNWQTVKGLFGKLKSEHIQIVDANRQELSLEALTAKSDGSVEFYGLDGSDKAVQLKVIPALDSEKIHVTVAYYASTDQKFERSLANTDFDITLADSAESVQRKTEDAISSLNDQAEFGRLSFLRSLSEFLFPSVHANGLATGVIVVGFAIVLAGIKLCSARYAGVWANGCVLCAVGVSFGTIILGAAISQLGKK